MSQYLCLYGSASNTSCLSGGKFPPPDAEVTKLEDATVSDLSTALAATSLDIQLPARPGYGKVGTPVVLWTNYFELKGVKPDTIIYRYSVAFQPDSELPKPKKKRLIELLFQREPFLGAPVASDWAQILVSAKKLDFEAERPTYEIEWYPADGLPLPSQTPNESARIKQARKKNTMRVLVEKLADVSIKDLLNDLKKGNMNYPLKIETVQALNIILGFGPSSNRNIAVAGGNKFYPFGAHPQFESYDLTSGLQALRGYFTSVRTSVNRILVNVNVATGAFYKAGPLLDLLMEIGGPPQNPEQHRRLVAFVRKLRIETNYIRETKDGKVVMNKGHPVTKRRVHTITDLSPIGKGADSTTFQFTDPAGKTSTLSIAQFFEKTHNVKLTKPKAPLVNYGTKQDPKWIPSELCSVVGGQLARRLLLGDQTRKMIEFAARRPFENAESIVNNGLQVTKIVAGQNAHLTKFGINVNTNLLTVNGRILQPPTLRYRQQSCRPNNGAWNLDTRQLGNQPFRISKPLGAWSCLVIAGGRPIENLRGHLESFRKTLDTYGMKPGPVPTPVFLDSIAFADIQNKRVDKIKNEISGKLRNSFKEKPKFLFILLPSDSPVLYDCIKLVCDVQLGISNICSIAAKFTKEKGQIQYFANVAMKFNQKLGGINHTINLDELKPLDATTIVVGIDVTHPSPGSSEESPSIAGIVASVDSNFAQYPASMRTQKGKQEMVTDLQEMVEERFRLWQKRNGGRLPTKVIVYRDGVSEGQYPIVMRDEYPHFVDAFNKLYGAEPKHPKMSLIVVGKRHHTRFYPTDENGTDGKTGNPKPGTVVDRGVTGEKLFDFFLLAHQGLQGTSKPAHYVVLKDDNKFGADQLQILVS